MNLHAVIDKAHEILARRHPRARYAHEVLDGTSSWSGAELQGRAKRFGGGYATQRKRALDALASAGGCVVPVEHGMLVAAIRTGQDDYGNAIYHTKAGPYWPGPKKGSPLRKAGA